MHLLKEQLKLVAQNHYEIPTSPSYEWFQEQMLNHIGDLDSELRDDLIYTTIAHWICENKLTNAQLKHLTKILIDDSHLFFKINTTDSSAVYTRSFSVLTLALIVNRHVEAPIFSKDEIELVFKRILQYSKEETNYIGYSNLYGWAHSTAHTADALDALSACEEFGPKEHEQILSCIKDKISVDSYVYVHKEDERLVAPLIEILTRKTLSEETWLNWINAFTKPKHSNQFSIQQYQSNINIRNFMRSFYFKIVFEFENETLINALLETQKK